MWYRYVFDLRGGLSTSPDQILQSNRMEDAVGHGIPETRGRKRALERNKGFVQVWGSGPISISYREDQNL